MNSILFYIVLVSTLKMLRGFFETVICLYFNLVMAYQATNPKAQYLEERIMDTDYYHDSDQHVHLAPIHPIHDIEMGSTNGCAKCKKTIYLHVKPDQTDWPYSLSNHPPNHQKVRSTS